MARKPSLGAARPAHSYKSAPAAGGLLGWLGLAFILLIADQFTKVLILGYYQLGDSTRVTDFFNVVRVHNSAAVGGIHKTVIGHAPHPEKWRPLPGREILK